MCLRIPLSILESYQPAYCVPYEICASEATVPVILDVFKVPICQSRACCEGSYLYPRYSWRPLPNLESRERTHGVHYRLNRPEGFGSSTSDLVRALVLTVRPYVLLFGTTAAFLGFLLVLAFVILHRKLRRNAPKNRAACVPVGAPPSTAPLSGHHFDRAMLTVGGRGCRKYGYHSPHPHRMLRSRAVAMVAPSTVSPHVAQLYRYSSRLCVLLSCHQFS
ncbi:hypothetical protein P280DRAFT_481614 [Massarina eburnea CBS 473.64]|uniref:Uncharacterized protein n=1 Tax=Massarina eburnea CBS 473.64 TaxID=1395130 RepID=A0A6A6RUX7_9PLEO|nr:hypothetical protein P280DRAFT_481614 [Massarina eburnea CBS 473.64]